MMVRIFRALVVTATVLCIARPALAAQSQEAQSLDELRNTVVNLLQALVDRGVLTREQAQAMVKNAQDKAVADATAAKQKEKDEAGAVRVPYVPGIVKDEIRKEVADELAPEVTKQVIQQAKTEQWGIPAALPDWIKRIRLDGDFRFRSEGDIYSSGNVKNIYLNFNAINSAGGFTRAGNAAYLNTSINRYFLLARLRLGITADLGEGWTVGSRLTTGTLTNPDSTNQILGQYGARYQTNIDQAYLKWVGTASHGRQTVTLLGGKFANPFLSSDLVWDTDVTFEGAALNYKLGIGRQPSSPGSVFLTVGAFPVQEVLLSTNDKWLYAAQTGIDLSSSSGNRLRFGVAYYDYSHIVGQKNTFESNLLDFTAPPYLQKGNTLFDIRNTQDTTQNLLALAADFRELDAVVMADWRISPAYRLGFYADYVKNVGYNEAEVAARYGQNVPARRTGYQTEVSFGSPELNHRWAWRAFLGYRYLQRDAVVDAFTDQDFHLGGTDAKGYFVGGDFNLSDRVWARMRYLPSDAIDGPPLGIDVWQLELNARF